ncbi:MAG: plasmid mobilization protein [Methylococcaceae bacterium]
MAAYLRAIALGYSVRSMVDNRQVEELIKITGELERLSKLLEHWKNHDPRTLPFSASTLRAALTPIVSS